MRVLHTHHSTLQVLPSDTHLTSAWRSLTCHSCPGNLPHKTHLCAHTEVTPAVGSPQQLCHCPPPTCCPADPQLGVPTLSSALLSPCPYFHICQGTSDPSCPKSPKLVISSREVHKRGAVQDTRPPLGQM